MTSAGAAVEGGLERVTGIEPALPAWKAGALPLSYTRTSGGGGLRLGVATTATRRPSCHDETSRREPRRGESVTIGVDAAHGPPRDPR